MLKIYIRKAVERKTKCTIAYICRACVSEV